MPYSRTDIANLAFSELGAETVTDVTAGETPHAIRVNAVFDQLYDEVLEAHPWRFAIRRAHLAVGGQQPLFGWQNAFPLPTVPWCLRPLALDGELPGEGWTFEGGSIYANRAGPLPLVYIARVGLERASALFAGALAYRIAKAVAFAVTNDRETEKTMLTYYRDKLSEARALNAQSAPADDGWAEYSSILEARS